jgi:trans-aconitate methyltransferase
MQALWDPDDYRRNAPPRTGWVTGLLPLLALAGNEAVLDLGPGDGHPASARPKPDGMVEVSMVRPQAVAGRP